MEIIYNLVKHVQRECHCSNHTYHVWTIKVGTYFVDSFYILISLAIIYMWISVGPFQTGSRMSWISRWRWRRCVWKWLHEKPIIPWPLIMQEQWPASYPRFRRSNKNDEGEQQNLKNREEDPSVWESHW